MKNIKFTFIVFASFFCFSFGSNAEASSEEKKPVKTFTTAFVEEELTSHDWTLKEIVQTKNDTAVNLTLFMLPCEKDNVLDYAVNGTYQISEGEKRCEASNERIKGIGTWEFDDDKQAIIDSYSGGRAINKKILELSPGMLKVEYEGEGNKFTTLTYFSEAGLQDDVLRELVEDNSNHSRNIAQIPREVMLEARRYMIIGLSDFKKGHHLEIDNKGGLLKKVTVYPFVNSTDPDVTILEDERNTSLIDQGRNVGLDYIVTGNIIKADSEINSKGDYCGNIKYSVSILDVANGEVVNQKFFEYSQLEVEKQQEKDMKLISRVLGAVGGNLLFGSWRYNYWNNYYDSYFISNGNGLRNDNLDAVFNNQSNDQRNQHFRTSIAVMNAIGNTSEDLHTYVLENIPITIVINDVEQVKGKFEKMIIEAGTNIGMKEEEKLKLVRIKATQLGDGTIVSNTTVIANLKVESVNGTRLSTCKYDRYSDRKKIAAALAENPEEIFVQTMELKKD